MIYLIINVEKKNERSYNVSDRRVYQMVRRTKKEFKPYNNYVDRPFELKWPTAFPLGELTEAIKSTDNIMLEILRGCLNNPKSK